MKKPLCWLLLLAVILDIQLSNCGVIIGHQRDLLWAEDKSTEVSKIEKRHDLQSSTNTTKDAFGKPEHNTTLPANETLNIHSNETQAAEGSTKELLSNKTEALNLNTAKIDEKIDETSQEETERQIRSNVYKKPCQSQLLSYNPLSFTPHELGQEYNPPPLIQHPPAYTKSIPSGNQNYNNPRPLPLPSYNQQGSAKDNKYPVVTKIQPQYYQNKDRPYNNQNPVKYEAHPHLLCKGGYSYSDKEGVCVLAKPRPQIPESKNYPIVRPYPVAGTSQLQRRVLNEYSKAKELVRPPLKQYGLQQKSHPVYNNEQKFHYPENPTEDNGAEEYKAIIQRPYGANSQPYQIKEYLPKPQYSRLLNYRPQNNGGIPPYSPRVLQEGQGKPRPYVQNESKKTYNYASLTHAPQYEKKEPPVESYETESKYEQPDEKYKPNKEPSSYISQNRNYAKPQQEMQYNVERMPPSSVSYASEEQHPSNEKNYQTANSNGYGQEDADSPEGKYASDDGKSSSEKECIPIRQYLAEKESSYVQGSEDSSEDSSHSKEYDSSYPETKSSSKYLEQRRKSSKNSSNKHRKSKYINPYVNLYTSEESNECQSSGRKKLKYSSGESKYASNHEMTYEDKSQVSCKKPKALKEIILPKGGFLLEGEYVLKRKEGSQYGVNEDYDKHNHCPNYPRIIDRITIGKGGYIHKGKYTLDKDNVEYDSDESDSDDYNNERSKKEIDNKTDDEDEDIEISIPFEIGDDDDDDGVHISTPREIDDEMFEGEELEEKKMEKRQLPTPRLPTIVVPVDLNLVDPVLRGVGKITNDVNKIKLKIKQKEIQREVNRAIKNLKHLNHDHKEKLDRFKSDLKNKLESKDILKTPLINRDAGNNVKTLSTTFNFNSPSLGGSLGTPILRQLRASKPRLLENPLERTLFPIRFSASDGDEDADTAFVRRQSTRPQAFENDDEEPPYQRNRLVQQNRARSQNQEDGYDDTDQPSRFNLLDPAPIPVKVNTYRPRHALTCPLESRQEPRSRQQDNVNDGRMNEVTEYELSLIPLMRRGMHTVKSLVFDVPENYPSSRRLRSPVVYERKKPQKVSRSVFNEDGYWHEKDFTDIAKVQRPREIIYSDVVYAAEPEDDYPYYNRQ